MQTELKTIQSRINSKNTKLSILTHLTHEVQNSHLALTGHDFYFLPSPHKNDWNIRTRALPPNCYIIGGIPSDLRFDLILSQERQAQFPKSKELSQFFGIPLVTLTHTMPLYASGNDKQLQYLQNCKGDLNIYITKHSRQAFNDEERGLVIENAVDTSVFNSSNTTRKGGVTVCNQLMGRSAFYDVELFQKIQKEMPIALIGDNGNLGPSIPDPKQLAQTVGSYEFYANLSTYSPLSMSLAEAMCLGLGIVSTNKQATSEFLTHGESALLTNDRDEYLSFCRLLIKDRELAQKLGQNAKRIGHDRFGLDRFVKQWNNIFWKAHNRDY